MPKPSPKRIILNGGFTKENSNGSFQPVEEWNGVTSLVKPLVNPGNLVKNPPLFGSKNLPSTK